LTKSLEREKDRISAWLKSKHYPAWVAFRHHRTRDNKSLDFKNHQYLKQIYLDESAYIAIMKGTQSAVSEWLHCRAISKAIMGRKMFYVLPTDRLVYRVVRNRIDMEVNFTRLYQGFAQATEAGLKETYRQASSMSLKQFGLGTIAFVPSNSSPAFTEYAADEVIIDELDECDPDNLIMAWERLGASEYRMQVKVGNPTIKVDGSIADEYDQTDRKRWLVPCPSCGKETELDWFKHVVREVDEKVYVIRDKSWDWENDRDIKIICDSCGKPIDRRAPGRWQEQNKSIKSGYQISQLFASEFTIVELVDRFNKGLLNESKLQRFYNGTLGKPYTSPGSRITEELLNSCLGEHLNGQHIKVGVGIMGADVNDTVNVVVGRLLPDRTVMVTYIAEIEKDETALLSLAQAHDVKIMVLDALPEGYFVKKIKSAFRGAFACYYAGHKEDHVDKTKNIDVDRTMSLDEVRGMFASKSFSLPKDAGGIPEFYPQMTAAQRVFDPKMGKIGAYVWREGSKPDHYHHTVNYLVLAAKIVVRNVR